jgi:hypothetical protein
MQHLNVVAAFYVVLMRDVSCVLHRLVAYSGQPVKNTGHVTHQHNIECRNYFEMLHTRPSANNFK